jgi:hypothetical protein
MNKDEMTEEIIEEPLGDDDIRYYLPDAKIMKYSELKKYNTIEDLLPKNKDYAIILYENSPNQGHWVALMRYDPYIEYFDSYGGKVDNPLNWGSSRENAILKQDKKILSNMFDRTKLDVIYNPTKFQGDGNDVNTCGRHAIFRIKNMIDCNRNLSDYYKFMNSVKKESKNKYDEIVSHLIDKI